MVVLVVYLFLDENAANSRELSLPGFFSVSKFEKPGIANDRFQLVGKNVINQTS